MKTVLIDFDGTLADSYPRLFSAYVRFMELNGKKGTMEDFKELVGYTLPEIVEIVIAKHNLKCSSSQLLEAYGSILKQVYNHEVQIFPGALDVLNFLKSKNIQLAIVTAANKSLVTPFLEKYGILHHFDIVVSPQWNTKGKPAPDLYLHALKLLNLAPVEAIALEDSFTGIASATNAGIFAILIKNVFYKKLDREYGNAMEVDSWHQLGDILQQMP